MGVLVLEKITAKRENEEASILSRVLSRMPSYAPKIKIMSVYLKR